MAPTNRISRSVDCWLWFLHLCLRKRGWQNRQSGTIAIFCKLHVDCRGYSYGPFPIVSTRSFFECFDLAVIRVLQYKPVFTTLFGYPPHCNLVLFLLHKFLNLLVARQSFQHATNEGGSWGTTNGRLIKNSIKIFYMFLIHN